MNPPEDRHAGAANLLLVDDDPTSIAALRRAVAGLGELRFALSGHEALRLVRDQPPDLILLDAEMPGMGGIEVCRALKADPLSARIPVIFVTSHADEAFELAGLQAGAADFIGKPIRPALLLARSRTHLNLKLAADALRRLSTTDALTGLANRRHFDDALRQEWRRVRRQGLPMSLLMIDVDHFKHYNDHYGHPAGEVCLQAVAAALARASQRPGDLVARYGGEEFVVLLPGTAAEGAAHVARGIVEALDSLAIAHAASPVAAVLTISIGIGVSLGTVGQRTSDTDFGALDSTLADMPMPEGAAALLHAADRALYAAKRGGRAQAWSMALPDAMQPAPLALRSTRSAR